MNRRKPEPSAAALAHLKGAHDHLRAADHKFLQLAADCVKEGTRADRLQSLAELARDVYWAGEYLRDALAELGVSKDGAS